MSYRRLDDGDVVDAGDWAAHGTARVFASGRATVVAYGRSVVRAGGRAKIVALDEAEVWAADGVHVEAYGRSTVHAIDDSHVEAHEQASIEARIIPSTGPGGEPRFVVDAYGESRILAIGRTQVYGSDDSGIRAQDDVLVGATHGSRIILHDRARIFGALQEKVVVVRR